MKKENKGVLFENLVSLFLQKDLYLCKIVFIHFCKKKICSVFHCENSEVHAIYTIFEDCRMLW